MNTLITTNKSESDTALAAIGQTLTTKITATDATAISQNVLAAEFSDPNSYITNSAWYVNNVKTYADATSGNTTSLDAMATVVTDPVTGITATANNIKTGYTTIGLNSDGTLSATANQSAYISAAIGPQKVSIDAVDNITIDSIGAYTATTSKFITGADGAISGWTNSNYNGRSDFTIAADTFKVQGVVSGYTPFAIDTVTGKIKFTGDVTFAGLGIDGNSTNIDGSKITTGKIQSADTSTYFDLANNRIKMHNTTGLGFTLDSTALGTSTDPNIQGGYIKGTTIEGATIDATSTIQADHVYVKSIIPGNLCAPIVFITNTRGVSGTTNVSVATPSKILYSPSYSTGILANRVKSTSTIISGVAAIFGSTGLTKSNTAVYLQSSPDGASWTTIASAGGVSTSIISSDITIDTTNNVYLRVYGVSNSDGNWKGPTSAYVKMEYHILN